jgi:hypothetical protein
VGSPATIFLAGETAPPPNALNVHGVVMIAVIGNVIAGLGVVGLFTATLRLTRSTK